MPELPEVETTVQGIRKYIKGLSIKDVWTSYNSPHHIGKKNIKDPKYFTLFRKEIAGKKIMEASRRAKNVLVHLSHDKTLAIHMKMTGHLIYGDFIFRKGVWEPKAKKGPLRDPFNKFIRLVFTLSNGKHLAFSDMRKFGKVFVTDTKSLLDLPEFKKLGPEPLEKSFDFEKFRETVSRRPNGKIKQVLMDQEIISGIGNIYSDEILWKGGVHPLSLVSKIPTKEMKRIFTAMKETLRKGIDFGGDSMSDYRNLEGKPGKFQHAHNAYRLTGKPCKKKGCRGKIERMKVGGRSAHFCSVHQKLFLQKKARFVPGDHLNVKG